MQFQNEEFFKQTYFEIGESPEVLFCKVQCLTFSLAVNGGSQQLHTVFISIIVRSRGRNRIYGGGDEENGK